MDFIAFMVEEDPFHNLTNIINDFETFQSPFPFPDELDLILQENDHLALDLQQTNAPTSYHIQSSTPNSDDVNPTVEGNGGGDRRRERSPLPGINGDPLDEGDMDGDRGKNGNHKQKLMVHMEVERQRRQEMASLHQSLRSLLPLEYVNGKRSMSDHLHEAVKYIRHLKARNQVLRDKRDKLKAAQNGTSSVTSASDTNANSASYRDLHRDLSVQIERCSSDTARCSGQWADRVVVKASRDGVEVLVRISQENGNGMSLSRVLKALAQEGLDVTSCFSTHTQNNE